MFLNLLSYQNIFAIVNLNKIKIISLPRTLETL